MSERLSEKALLVRLSISQWTARKHDKRVTAEVARNHNTAADVGRYNKRLVGDRAIKAVAKVANAARTDHYYHTLPWLDDGARILPSKNYIKYCEVMRSHKAEFDAVADQFSADYPQLREQAERDLNGLFDINDYPPTWEIRNKFGFELGFLPLPETTDFRVILQAEEMD